MVPSVALANVFGINEEGIFVNPFERGESPILHDHESAG
jgi:hypothetical protein